MPTLKYKVAELADFRILAIEKSTGNGLLLARPTGLFSLTSTLAPDGRYRTRAGSVISVVNTKNGDPDYDYPEDFAP